MNLSKTELKGLKSEGTKLQRKVINVLLDQGTSEEIASYISDILNHGCQSGIVGELIYYSDTMAFYNKYKRDINNLLVETMDSTGAKSPKELFGDKWDNGDPFAEDTQNQTLLAWFSFEETVRSIADTLGLEY